MLPTYCIDEARGVFARKAPKYIPALERFLSSFPFHVVFVEANPPRGKAEIRDEKDYPVLYCAIQEDIEILVTGDKDFKDAKFDSGPEIMTPSEFLQRYMR